MTKIFEHINKKNFDIAQETFKTFLIENKLSNDVINGNFGSFEGLFYQIFETNCFNYNLII